MARIRYLKPDFFEDEDIAVLPYWVRLLFQGLWVLADKEGRLEDRPVHIRIKVFPYEHKIDIEKGLSILAQKKRFSPRPFILRYNVDGEKYIQIINWKRHQKPHHTEKDSIIPPPDNGELTDKQPLVTGECQEGMGMGMGMGKGMGKEYGSNKSKKDSSEQPMDAKERYFQSVEKFFSEPDGSWLKTIKETYASLDVEREFKKMKAWLVSNYPSKMKRNFRRFATNWLNKEIDRPSRGEGAKGGYDYETYKKLKKGGIKID